MLYMIGVGMPLLVEGAPVKETGQEREVPATKTAVKPLRYSRVEMLLLLPEPPPGLVRNRKDPRCR